MYFFYFNATLCRSALLASDQQDHAVFHISRFGKVDKAEAAVENFRELHEPENVEDPDSDSPII
jgi:hypothetical protein